MKVSSKEYRGIHFIQLDDLPGDQAEMLKQVVSPENIFKIRTEKEIMAGCIQYRVYEAWFEENHKISVN